MTTIFDPSILRNNPAVRGRMLAILQAALDAVRPDLAVKAQLHRSGSQLSVAGETIDLAACRRVFVLGAGKAGAPMTQAVEEVLGDHITGGLVVVKEGHGGPTQHVELVEAGHPVPTEAALAPAPVCSRWHRQHKPAISSSSSSLAAAQPCSKQLASRLADLQALTAALLACGATIGEINCLRKHLSLIKGGQLARAVYPARLVTLVLSDVVGSPLDVIASGPDCPRPYHLGRCLAYRRQVQPGRSPAACRCEPPAGRPRRRARRHP